MNCSDVIKQYDKFIYMVLAEMLISLDRTSLQTKPWHVRLLFHRVDISEINT